MESLIQANSLFPNSLEGRFALDIMRSVLQTAIAARVPLLEYLNHVLRSDPEEIRQNPENFTAFNFKSPANSDDD